MLTHKSIMRSQTIFLILLSAGLVLATVGVFFRPVRAQTSVEGHITTDTMWALVDSPYVVTGDVIVDDNVTLTIEAGVEIRFGGNFFLLAEGNITAIGNQTHKIIFTSNKMNPSPSDWESIYIRKSFVHLEYVVVKFARNGIYGESGGGQLRIKNSDIQNIEYSGIIVYEGDWKQSIIAFNKISNTGTGITLELAQNVELHNNRIFSNSVGLNLHFGGENLTVINNTIYSNSFGIRVISIYAPWGGVTIQHNTIHSNAYGLWTDFAIDHVTNNTFAYNDVGIYFDFMISEVNYNNIYENEVGVDGTGDAAANVEYNYWGDPTGPYHVSLNPTGKGNPVGGVGTSLDFIPFLTSPVGTINQRPVAILDVDKTNPNVDETVTFDASASTDDGRIDYYFFDFGDGTNSSWTPLSVVTHKYSSEGTYNATLIVMDDFGVTSLDGDLVYIEITVIPEFPASLILPLFMIATLLAAIVYRRKRTTIS